MTGPLALLVKKWFEDLGRCNLDGVVGIFAENAVVTYGAGASSSAIDFAGVYTGKKQIEQYYRDRFAGVNQRQWHAIRPFCSAVPDCIEVGPWVASWGAMTHVDPDTP